MAEKDGQIEAFPEAADISQSGNMREKSWRMLGRTKTAASWKDMGPPPDGGVRAWTQVLVGHLVIMNTW